MSYILPNSVEKETINSLLDNGNFAVYDKKDSYNDFLDKYKLLLDQSFSRVDAQFEKYSFFWRNARNINQNQTEYLIGNLRDNLELKKLFRNGLDSNDFRAFNTNFRNTVYSLYSYNDWFTFLLHANKELKEKIDVKELANHIAKKAHCDGGSDLDGILESFGNKIGNGSDLLERGFLDDKNVFKKKTWMTKNDSGVYSSIILGVSKKEATTYSFPEESFVTPYMVIHRGLMNFILERENYFNEFGLQDKRNRIKLDKLSSDEKSFVKKSLIALENLSS